MRTLTVVFFLLLSGCSHFDYFDYPGGPKDIARQNQLIQKKMEEINRQREIGERREVERRAEKDASERLAIVDYKARQAKAEEEKKARDDESRKSLEAFTERTSAEFTLAQKERETARELGQKHTGDIEKYIKDQLKQTKIGVRCGFNDGENEIRCALTAPETPEHDPRYMHDLQTAAHVLAVQLRGVYPANYSIFAQTSDDIPLARFMYNYQFDILTPLIMWH